MSAYLPVGKAAEALRRSSVKVADPLEDPVIRRLTRQVSMLRGQLVHDSAAILMKLGRLLEDGMARLDLHDYKRWLRALSISVSTAKHWRAIFRLGRLRPRFLERIREVGAVKLWRLAAMKPKEARRLLATLGVEGITQMNKGAFLTLTAPHVRITPNGHVSRRATGLVNKIHQWCEELDRADVRQLRQPAVLKRLENETRQLRRALGRLEKALQASKENARATNRSARI